MFPIRQSLTQRTFAGLALMLWATFLCVVALRAATSGPAWGVHVARSPGGDAVVASVGGMSGGWGVGLRPDTTLVSVDGADARAFIDRDLPSSVRQVTFRDASGVSRTEQLGPFPASLLAVLTAGALLFATLGGLVRRWSADANVGRLFVLLSGSFATALLAGPAAVLGYEWAGYLTSGAALLASATLFGLFGYFPRRLRHARAAALCAIGLAAGLATLTLAGDSLGSTFAATVESASWVLLLVNCLAALALVGLRSAHASDRRALRPLLFGTAIGVAPALALSGLPRLVGLQPLCSSEITAAPVAAIPLSFAYSIVRHHVFGLDVLMRKLLLRICGALLSVAMFFAAWLLLQSFGLPATEAALLSTVLGSLALPSLLVWTHRGLDRWLYRPLHGLRSQVAPDHAERLEGLGAATTERLRELLPVQWAACLVHDDTTPSNSASRRVLGADGQLPLWLDTASPLDQSPTEVTVAPIHRFDSGVILLLTGPRLDGDRLDGIQTEALRGLAQVLAPSFEAALLRERAEEEARFRQGLTDLARDLAAAGTVKDVHRAFLSHAAGLLCADSASLWRPTSEGAVALVDPETFGAAPSAEAVRVVLARRQAHGGQRDWLAITADGASLGVALDDGGDQPLICVIRRIFDPSRFGCLEERRARELVEHTTGALRRAAEREMLEEQLRNRAFYDALTGLPNRALFLDRVSHGVARGGRLGRELALLFIDLDRFKVVNDSLGHSAGDELLVQVGRRLRECLRESDTIARLGGDEFTVLLEGATATADATAAAERILATLRSPFVLGGQETYVSASIGISGGAAGREPGRDLLREADIALYRAKASGRGRYTVFEPRMSHLPAEHLHMERDLHRAIERNELRIHYQPIFSLADSQMTGLEALVRWEHPEKGLVAPGHFIPLAEDTGLILPIGTWVLEQACRQMREWQDRFPDTADLFVSVNLSARQLQDPDLLDDVNRALASSGLDPAGLQLEITESVVMHEPEATVFKLHALKALGIKLAVDDFGTGYSSLAYLKRFPIDVLKIDRAFVSGLGQDEHDSAIVKTVVGLARDLGLRTTAEGIEERSQWAQLEQLGCDQGQGYVFARPLRPDAVLSLFATSLGGRVVDAA